ncbi:MAG: TIM barrel protein [Planctomycetota bacterium]
MEEHFSHYMQVGIVSFAAFPDLGSGKGDVVAAMEMLADDPLFEQIDVTRVDDPAERRKAASIAQSANMRVAFGAHPVILSENLDLSSCDEGARTAAVKRLLPFIGEAVEWKAFAFVVLSGKDPGEASRDKALDALVRSLIELAAASRSQGGPTIVLETFDRVPFGKNCLVGPTDLAVQVARKVRKSHPDFGLLLDLSHLPLLDEDPRQSLLRSKGLLSCVHIGNCIRKERYRGHPAYGDNHPPFGIPEGENGVRELRDFLAALFEVGYLAAGRKPVVGFELKPPAGMSVEALLENARSTLGQAWAQLRVPGAIRKEPRGRRRV